MAYIGKTPTPVPLTSSDIASDIINSTHIGDTAISGFSALGSEPADTDEFLISDAGTLKRMDYSYIKGGAGLNLISTSTTSSGVSEIDITSGIDSTYTKYLISIINLHPSGNSTPRIRFFTGSGGSQAVDTGSNYRNSMIGFRNDRSSEISHGDSADSYMDAFSTQNVGSGDDNTFTANLFLINPANTTFDTILHGDYAQVDDGGRICHGIFASRYLNTGNAVTGIRFYLSTGTIDNATIKLYGIS